MKKLICIAILSIFLMSNSYSQDEKSKLETFSSKSGVIVKYVDQEIEAPNLRYGGIDTKIREIISGGETMHFLIITKPGEYSSKRAAIAKEDLAEVIKAFEELRRDSMDDIKLDAEEASYLENKFNTEDGYSVGYYMDENQKINWFFELEKYGSDDVVFISSAAEIEEFFTRAMKKINQMEG